MTSGKERFGSVPWDAMSNELDESASWCSCQWCAVMMGCHHALPSSAAAANTTAWSDLHRHKGTQLLYKPNRLTPLHIITLQQ